MASAPLSRSLAVANPRTGIDDYRIEPLDSTAVAALAMPGMPWCSASQ